MNRTTRLILLTIAAIGSAAGLGLMAERLGSVVWLSFLLCGLVTDIEGGPWWANAAIYAPTAIIYMGALGLGIAWVRKAPRNRPEPA